MIWTVEITKNSIITNPAAASETVNTACRRHHGGVSGICDNDHTVQVIIDSEANQAENCYRFAEMPGTSEAEIAAEIKSRWHAGFATIGNFSYDEHIFALFRKDR